MIITIIICISIVIIVGIICYTYYYNHLRTENIYETYIINTNNDIREIKIDISSLENLYSRLAKELQNKKINKYE